MFGLTPIEYVVNVNLIPAIALVVLLVFVCANPLFQRRQSTLFVIAIAAILTAIVSVSLDTIISYRETPDIYILRRITSFLNFALTPLVPFLLLKIFNLRQMSFYWTLPIIINTILCFISIFVKNVVFFISSSNDYNRGVMFIFPLACCFFYMIVIIFRQRDLQFQNKRLERWFILSSIVFLVLGTLIEIVFYYRCIVWGLAGVIFVMYYLLLNIYERITDSLTGLYNRAMYDRALQQVNRRKKCIIAIIDLNDFKIVNDIQGHDVGDQYLIRFSKLLNKHLGHVATVYRMGGDEFFCISKKIDLDRFKSLLSSLATICEKNDLAFAWGAIEYKSDTDIAEAVKEADILMYKDKQTYKAPTILA